VLDFFARQAMPQPQLLPMCEARLVAINQRSINGDSYADSRRAIWWSASSPFLHGADA